MEHLRGRTNVDLRPAFVAALVFAIVCGCFTSAAVAQTSTGGIRGIARDDTGGVLVGVTVEVAGPALIGGATVQVTNDQGLYHFERLAIGIYTVTFTLQGFTTVRRENIRVEVGRTIDVDVTLTLSSVQEMITVSGAAPVVDSLHSGTSTNFNVQLLENIPTTRTSWFDTVSFAPAVRTDQQNANNATFILYGSNSDQNSYQFEGIDIGGTSGSIVWDFPNPDMVQELQVVGIGASAEYYGFQGAIVNVITKAGSNTWKGRTSFFFIEDGMVGKNTPNEANPFKIDYQQSFTAEFGGPIKRDKLWVIGMYERYRVHNAQVGIPLEFAPRAHRHKPAVKINWAISRDNALVFAYSQTYYFSPGLTSRTAPQNTVNWSVGHQPITSTRWTRTMGSWTVFEVNGGGMYAPISGDPISGDFTTPGHFDIATGVASVNAQSATSGRQYKYSGAAILSHHADDFIKGSHDLKFGVQVRPKWTQTDKSTLIGGIFYRDLAGQPYYALTREPAVRVGRTSNSGVFTQDDWTVTNRVTVNLGVRFDHTTGNVPETDRLDAQFQKTGSKWPGVPDLIQFDNWSPRLGFTVKLDTAGKTVAKANYGRYYGRLNTGMFSTIAPGNTSTIALRYNTVTRRYDIPFFTINPNSNYAIDPNLENQYTDQFYVGIERQLMPDLGINLSYLRKKEDNFIRMRDATGVYIPQTVVDTFEGQTQTLTVYNLVSPVNASVYQVANRNDLRQDYNSVIVQANKRFSNRWQLLGSYQWQRARGFAGSAVTVQSQAFSSLDPGAYGSDPNDLVNAYGRFTTDSTHSLKLNLTVEGPWGLHFGLRESYESGRPYGRAVTVRGLRQGTRTVLAEPRGAYEMQATNDFQIRVDKAVRLSENRRLRFSLDVINVFNVETYTQVRNNSSQPNFSQALAVVSPRRAQIGVRFDF